MTARAERITMVTAYDATFARLLDEGGADVLLVGDSLGMVVQGQNSTLPVTLEDILYHTRAVARGCKRAHIVADMPFMSYQASVEDALRNAGRLLAEGGAHGVKLEGGEELVPTIQRMVAAGIPVMGHVGLTPQRVHAMGGFRVQGKSEAAANRVLADAKAVTQAGAYALVLEGIPAKLAGRIRREVHVPTIGIGAGADADGQVLVCYDLLGLTPDPTPKFVKQYEQLYTRGLEAMARFREEVREGRFPTAAHSYGAAHKPRPEPRPLSASNEPEAASG